MPFELNRMRQKIDASAKYVVTQPIIGKDENVDKLKEFEIPVVVEAWMSKNIDLLYKSVGKKKMKRQKTTIPPKISKHSTSITRSVVSIYQC